MSETTEPECIAVPCPRRVRSGHLACRAHWYALTMTMRFKITHEQRKHGTETERFAALVRQAREYWAA